MKRAYWWCSQGRNFAFEYSVGLIWAPKREFGKLHHWDAVAKVQKGDLIFSYVRGELVATGTASANPEIRQRPTGNMSGTGNPLGYGVSVSYSLIKSPIKLDAIPKDVRERLAGKNGPLNKNLKGVQGYLFAVPSELAESLLLLANPCA